MLTQGVAEAESRRAADIAETAYQQAFNQNVPADEPALDREFDRALNIGQKAFREVAVGLYLCCLHQNQHTQSCSCNFAHTNDVSLLRNDLPLVHALQAGGICLIAAGETNIQAAHEKRFQDRVQQLFNQLKKQRLTSAAFECEKLVNSAKDKLIEVCILL